MYERELFSVLRSEKDKKKVISKKYNKILKYYSGLFDYNLSNGLLKSFKLLNYNVPYALKTNDETEEAGIFISKVSIMITICDLFSIDASKILKSSVEDTYEELKNILRQKRKDLKDIKSLDELSKLVPFSLPTIESFSNQQLTHEKENKLLNFFVDSICNSIKITLIDLKILMTKKDLDLTNDIIDYIDSEKFELWLCGTMV